MRIEFHRHRDSAKSEANPTGLQRMQLELRDHTNTLSSDYLNVLADHIFNERHQAPDMKFRFPMPDNYNGVTDDRPLHSV